MRRPAAGRRLPAGKGRAHSASGGAPVADRSAGLIWRVASSPAFLSTSINSGSSRSTQSALDGRPRDRNVAMSAALLMYTSHHLRLLCTAPPAGPGAEHYPDGLPHRWLAVEVPLVDCADDMPRYRDRLVTLTVRRAEWPMRGHEDRWDVSTLASGAADSRIWMARSRVGATISARGRPRRRGVRAPVSPREPEAGAAPAMSRRVRCGDPQVMRGITAAGPVQITRMFAA